MTTTTAAPMDMRTHGYYCPHGYAHSWLLLPPWICAPMATTAPMDTRTHDYLTTTTAPIDMRTHGYYYPHRYTRTYGYYCPYYRLIIRYIIDYTIERRLL